MFRLSECDLAEIAVNSIMISGFSHEEKVRMLGEGYHLGEPEHLDPGKTSLPYPRVAFRHRTLVQEHSLIRSVHDGKIQSSNDEIDASNFRPKSPMSSVSTPFLLERFHSPAVDE